MQITIVVDFVGGAPAARLLGVLGAAVSQRNQRVVLLDADMRRPVANAEPFASVEDYFSGTGIRKNSLSSEDLKPENILTEVNSSTSEQGRALAVVRHGEIAKRGFDSDLWYLRLKEFSKKLGEAGWQHLLLRIPPQQDLAMNLVGDTEHPAKVLSVSGADAPEQFIEMKFLEVFPKNLTLARVTIEKEDGKLPTDEAEEEKLTWTISNSTLELEKGLIAEMCDWVELEPPAQTVASNDSYPRVNPFGEAFPWNVLCPSKTEYDLLPDSDQGFERYQELLDGIARTISLKKAEKIAIVDKAAQGAITEYQFKELLKILDQERKKFRALSPKHLSQLWTLCIQQFLEWAEILSEKNLLDKPPLAAILDMLESGHVECWTKSTHFFLKLSDKLASEKETKIALRILELGVQYHPDSWLILESKGLLDDNEGRSELSIKAFEQAVRIAPPSRLFGRRYLAGLLLERQQDKSDIERAGGLFSEMLEAHREYALSNTTEVFYAEYGLGDIARINEQFDLALKHYLNALECIEEDSQKRKFLLERIIRTTFLQGGKDIQIWVERFLETEPENSDSLSRVGSMAFRSGEIDAANRCYQKLITLSPTSIEERVLVAELGMLLGSPDVSGLLKLRSSEKKEGGEKYGILIVLLRLLDAVRNGLPTAVRIHYETLKKHEPQFSRIENWEYGDMRTLAGQIEDADQRKWALECIDQVAQSGSLPDLRDVE